MTVVVGIDLGHDALRVAALVDGQPELVVTLPAWVAWTGDDVLVGDAARARPAEERLGGLPSWLERTADDGPGGGPGPLGCVWPLAGGAARAPAEAAAWLLRAAMVAVEERHGPVLGAVFAVDPSLGIVGRRALRDAAQIAGIPASRQISTPACAALLVPGGVDGAWLVLDAGAGALTISALERVGGALQGVSSIRDRELGGGALDATIAAQLELDGGVIDDDDAAWPALCAVARAIKEATPGALAVVDPQVEGTEARVDVPAAVEVTAWLAARLSRLDEQCQRALAAAGVTAGEVVEVLAIGGGAALAGLLARIAQALGRPPRTAGDPGAIAALGAAVAARMFLAEPAALFLDVVHRPLALSDGGSREPLVPAGTIAPTRAIHVVPTAQADQERLELELWEDGPRPRPYARVEVSGLPHAPAGDAIATCDLTVDADRLPALVARELVSGAPLSVVTVAEAALEPAALSALRDRVTSWRP